MSEDSDLGGMCDSYEKLPTTIASVKRIIAIGDIHGDYKLAVNSLKIAKLINDDLEWIAEPADTIVIQVGDQIDRCRMTEIGKCAEEGTTHDDEDSDLKIMKFYTDMHAKAKKKGGAVYSLLGNHEIMNVQGNTQYVSYLGLKGYKEGRAQAFKQGGEIAKFMACTRNTVMIIGSNLFVHAAIMPELLKKHGSDLSKINSIVRKWLLGKITGPDVNEILNSVEISPFWPRILGDIYPKGGDCDKYLNPLFETFTGLTNMIIGHTPQFFTNKHGINAICDNRVYHIDVGASDAFYHWDKNVSENRKVQVLEILDDDQFNIIRSDGSKKNLTKKNNDI